MEHRKMSSTRRAFTLLEVVVAVGLLAIVTVAIASVFATVGDTVTAGKRVSTLNRYSARLERIMRADFAAMNRAEGFLVIRNEYARSDWSQDFDLTAASSKVPLYDGQPPSQQKARRIDEIMFFTEGAYTSARTPVSPDFEASGGAARVYYGHGQKMPRDLTNDRYTRPRLDETNAYPEARLGETSTGAVLNPNEFASDWTLLRHVTVIIPETARRRELPDLVYGLEPNLDQADFFRVSDHSRQVGMQPAAQSIFRTLAYLPPRDIEVNNPSGFDVGIRPLGVSSPRIGGVPTPVNNIPWRDEPTTSPIYVGGLVDIAVTSMSEIKSWVTSPFATRSPGGAGLPTRGTGGRLLPTYPSQKPRGIANSQQWFRNYYEAVPRVNRDEYDQIADTSGKIAPMRGITRLTAVASDTELADQSQQLWMLDALPSVPFDNRPQVVDNTGHRIRYEDQPPQLFASLPASPSNEELLLEAIEQADQEMLSSSIFLPGCSEFIVEWTYGIVDERNGSPTEGQPIWYGLRRWAEFDGNADTYQTGSGDILLADTFSDIYDEVRVHGTYNNNDWLNGTGPLTNNNFRLPDDFLLNPNSGIVGPEPVAFPLQRLADSVVLRDRTDRNGGLPDADDAAAIEQTFGYVDFDDDADDDGTSGDVLWSPLPWPKMIRITVRLTDPADETLETTYQATFRVPDPEAF